MFIFVGGSFHENSVESNFMPQYYFFNCRWHNVNFELGTCGENFGFWPDKIVRFSVACCMKDYWYSHTCMATWVFSSMMNKRYWPWVFLVILLPVNGAQVVKKSHNKTLSVQILASVDTHCAVVWVKMMTPGLITTIATTEITCCMIISTNCTFYMYYFEHTHTPRCS